MDNLELIQEITELRGHFDMLQKEYDLVSQEKQGLDVLLG